jgi:tetratricopeptide (TPR) repeat protein
MIAATGDERLFAQATMLYKQGQFDQALETYAKIIDKDRTVYFNQGNCAFKLQRYGKALLFWRRAERDWGMFGRQELDDNIALVKKITRQGVGQQTGQGPWNALQTSAKNIKNSYISYVRAIPLFMFQILFLLLWALFFMLLKWFKRNRRGIVIMFVAIIYVSAGLLLVSKYSESSRVYGIVTTQQAPLYSGPGETYQTLGSLGQAHEVIIQRESDGYYKIKAAPLFGWIAKNIVDIV